MRALPLLAVGLGGAFGTGARVGLSLAAQAGLPNQVYLATLLSNILGAVLIGYLSRRSLPALGQAFLMTGFCGGFTTFSLFSLETLLLAQLSIWMAAAYTGASLLLWSIAVWAGYRFGQPKNSS